MAFSLLMKLSLLHRLRAKVAPGSSGFTAVVSEGAARPSPVPVETGPLSPSVSGSWRRSLICRNRKLSVSALEDSLHPLV